MKFFKLKFDDANAVVRHAWKAIRDREDVPSGAINIVADDAAIAVMWSVSGDVTAQILESMTQLRVTYMELPESDLSADLIFNLTGYHRHGP